MCTLGDKKVYRLYESSGEYKMDLITAHDEEAPIANKKIMYRNLITVKMKYIRNIQNLIIILFLRTN